MVNALRAQAVLVSLLCLACSKPGEDSEAKRSPIPEPAPGATVPEALSIPVELEGKVVFTITTEMLEARKPDFKDDERQAWRLDKLLDESVFPKGSVLEASGSDGVGISMNRPASDEEPLPVVVLTRRAEILSLAGRADAARAAFQAAGAQWELLPERIRVTAAMIDLHRRIAVGAAQSQSTATQEHAPGKDASN